MSLSTVVIIFGATTVGYFSYVSCACNRKLPTITTTTIIAVLLSCNNTGYFVMKINNYLKRENPKLDSLFSLIFATNTYPLELNLTVLP